MPFLWIALSFIAGIVAASLLKGSAPVWWVLTGISALLGVGIIAGKRNAKLSRLVWIIPATRLPVCLLPALLFLSGALYLNIQPRSQPDRLFYYNNSGKSIAITAEVAQPPDLRTRSTLAELRVIDFTVGGVTYKGGDTVMAMMPANTALEFGDRLNLIAKPETPFENEDFSYREYLASQQIYTLISYPHIDSRTPASPWQPGLWLYRFRAHLIDIIGRIFPAPESGLITGIMLGPRNNISDELYNAFRNSGTSHIIAISGFNIAILAGMISVVCLRAFGRMRGALMAIITIALYAVLVGGGASVVRASIMGGMTIISGLLGRKQTGLNTLAFTAFCMLLISPMTLWDVGFQLSFLATLGLIWFGGTFQEKFKEFAIRFIPQVHVAKVADWVGEYFLFTIAAQITTLPVLLYHFHQAPLALLIANPLALPAQPALMGFSAAAMAAGLIWLPLGKIVGMLALPFTTYTIRVVEWAAGLHLPMIQVAQILPIFIVIYFVVLVMLVTRPKWLDKIKSSVTPMAAILGLSLGAVWLWHMGVDAPDGKLHITLMGGKNAGTILIQSPTGRYMLINGREDKNMLLSTVGKRLPVNFRKLDDLILAPGSTNDLLALPGALPGLEVENFWQVGSIPSSKALTNLTQTIGGLGKSLQTTGVGDRFDMGNGAALAIVQADGADRVMEIDFGNFSMLLCFGGVDGSTLPPAGVVYVKDDNGINFDRFTPQLLVVDAASSGTDIPAISTGERGWITITTDGTQMWLESER